jgi:DNA-binding protein H-NS
MFNNYDPYEEIERIKAEVMMLRSNDTQIALAHNNTLQQVNQLAQQLRTVAEIQSQIATRQANIIHAIHQIETYLNLPKYPI